MSDDLTWAKLKFASDTMAQQSSELTRLRIALAELERKDADWRRASIKQGNELYAQKVRITSLEAQLEAFRVALEAVRIADMRKAGCNSEDAIEYDGPAGKIAARALMSALRMEGEKDDE